MLAHNHHPFWRSLFMCIPVQGARPRQHLWSKKELRLKYKKLSFTQKVSSLNHWNAWIRLGIWPNILIFCHFIVVWSSSNSNKWHMICPSMDKLSSIQPDFLFRARMAYDMEFSTQQKTSSSMPKDISYIT